MNPGELLRRLQRLVFRDHYTRELEEEMRLHRELRAEQLRGGGLTTTAARHAAQRKFGNTTHHQERSRDMWGMEWFDTVIADVRFAVRRLRSRPAFAGSTILVAALGIGATTAVFSAVDAAILRPLPFYKPHELLTLDRVIIPFGEEADERNAPRRMVDVIDIDSLKTVFSAVAAYAAGGLNLEDQLNPRRVSVGVVSASFFSTLGVQTSRGRVFSAAEGRPGGPRVTILSDALWRSQFGGADSVIGKTVALHGNRYEIIGVMPDGFSFPNESDLWIPLSVPTTRETFAPFRGYLPSEVIARLAPGVSADAARLQLVAYWTRALGKPEPGRKSDYDGVLDRVLAAGVAVPLQQYMVGNQRKAFVILMGATVLLLLIACANVANLLLSDGATRRREVAVREVLGASRGRIVRQLLVESILLSLSGTLLGLALSPAALGSLRALLPQSLVGTTPIHIDLRVLMFATVVALVTGIVFGLWPSLGTTQVDAGEAIKSSGGHGGTSGRLGLARRVLITAEITLTVMLLVGSGLMLKSFSRLVSQDFGMRTGDVGTLELTFPRPGVRMPVDTTSAHYARIVREALDRIRATPGVSGAGVVNDLPLRGSPGISVGIDLVGSPKPKDADYPRYLIADAGYFNVMRIPVLSGRTFQLSDDTIGGRRHAVVSRAMARAYWPNASPLGQRFHWGGDTARTFEVIGVVADVREYKADEAPGPQVYLSAHERSLGNLALVARGTIAPGLLLARMQSAIHEVAPTQAVFNVRTMEDVVSRSVAPRRTQTLLIGIFGGLALVLSAFGVYAVVSYSVTQRSREFGIRTALGAARGDILALVSADMSKLILTGLALGLAGAWALSRILASLLFEVAAHDFATYALVPLVLLIPAAMATLVPSLRATRVSPTEVMRAE